MRLDANHFSKRHILLPAEWRADGDDLLPVCEGRLRSVRAVQRNRPHRRSGPRIDPEDRDIPHAIGHEDARRDFDDRRELHVHDRCAADDALVRHDEARAIDDDS
jgi:hypothetical protein